MVGQWKVERSNEIQASLKEISGTSDGLENSRGGLSLGRPIRQDATPFYQQPVTRSKLPDPPFRGRFPYSMKTLERIAMSLMVSDRAVIKTAGKRWIRPRLWIITHWHVDSLGPSLRSRWLLLESLLRSAASDR